MSWIDDWTGGFWSKAWDWVNEHMAQATANLIRDVGGEVPKPIRDQLGEQTARAGLSDSYKGIIPQIIGSILNIISRFKVADEADLQDLRIEFLKGTKMYPPDSDLVARLVHFAPDHEAYVEALANLQGKYPDVVGAYFELARKLLDSDQIRALYNRGVLTKEESDSLLKELGYRNKIKEFSVVEGQFWKETTDVKRPDRDRLRELFKLLPNIQDIIRMEVRDAFPKHPSEHPPETQTTAAFKTWAARHGTTPGVYDWSPGGGEDITEALKQETAYGPLSFASHFLGGREAYTRTFEKAAQAQGLDPYWSMKFWEAHWVLPGWSMLREMLFRTKEIDEEMFKTVLRWQDYPPALVEPILKASYHPLTRVDVRRMHLRGVIGVPRVFKSYLEFGYNVANAARMTAFTVIWNLERIYGKVITEILDSYSKGVFSFDEAGSRMWDLVSSDAEQTLPPWIADELTPEQIEGVKRTYVEIQEQKIVWIGQQLGIARTKRALELQQKRLATAKKQYVSWRWDGKRTADYLVKYGFVTARITALLEDWTPEREMEEKMPTRAQLEDFLLEQGMPVETWTAYMRRLGYGDALIHQFLEGTGTLPTRAMLEGFFKEDIIDEATFRDRMAKLGYDTWTILKTIELIKPMEEEGA